VPFVLGDKNSALTQATIQLGKYLLEALEKQDDSNS